MLRNYTIYCLLVGGLFLSYPAAAQISYVDINQGHWAWPYLQKVQGMGVLAPFESVQFSGDQPITRFEYLESISNLLDSLGTDSRQIDSTIETKKYYLELAEEQSDLEARMGTLEGKYQLHNILLEGLESKLAKLEVSDQKGPSSAATELDSQGVLQRITHLEETVSTLQTEINEKDKQLERLYIVLALLGATSILK